MVAPRPVIRFGNPCLRQRCRPADPGGPEATEILDALWSSLDQGDGVGLAAPQIGRIRRILVVKQPADGVAGVRHEMVNPVVTAVFGKRAPFEEGCLSFPGLYLPVWRRTGISVRYFDRLGQPRTLRDDGLVARIVQHEIDHLDGRLFIDHLPWWRRLGVVPRLWFIRLGGIRQRKADSE